MSDSLTEGQSPLLSEQAAYYRARAPEYDEWWQRVGRYDRGADATARWHAEVDAVEAALARIDLSGDVLELASGTGWWTERLAARAGTLTCIDASPETLEVNRARLSAAGLPLPRYELADLFDWSPGASYDVIFFSFWLSHVPEDRFAPFWASVAAALRPGGRVFLIDSFTDAASRAHNHEGPDENGIQARTLNDGRSFRIVKLYHQPAALNARLAELGWQAAIRSTATYFIHGEVIRPEAGADVLT